MFFRTGLIVVFLSLFISAFAVDEVPDYADYASAVSAAQKFASALKYEEAIQAYSKAVNLAASDAERAKALIGIGDAYQYIKHTTGAGKSSAGTTIIGDFDMSIMYYEKAAELPSLPQDIKIQALFSIADMDYRLLKGDEQRVALDKILQLPALPPEVKYKAYLYRSKSYYPFMSPFNVQDSIVSDLQAATLVSGITDEKKAEALLLIADNYAKRDESKSRDIYNQVTSLKGATVAQKFDAYDKTSKLQYKTGKPDEARATIAKALLLKGLKPDDKVNALQFSARILIEQNKPEQAASELAKIADISGLDSAKRVDIFSENGRLLFSNKLYAASRAEFEKALKYALKKSYIYPRDMVYIARTYEQEKNYDKAREVLNKLFLMAIVSSYEKEDGWLLMGSMYNDEKHFDKAIESYNVLDNNPQLSVWKKIQTQAGLARSYYGLQDYTSSKEQYLKMMAKIDEINKMQVNKMPMSPFEISQFKMYSGELYEEAKKKVEEIAGKN